MTRLLATLALSVTLAASSLTPSFGQGYGWPNMIGDDCPALGMMGGGMMGWGRMRGPDGMRGPRMMEDGARRPMMGAVVEGRLAYLKAELGITEGQADAWDAYAEALRAHAESMPAMHDAMVETLQEGTAVERLQARIATMEAMVEVMKGLQQPTEALYETLTDEQQALADQLIGCGGM